jgi:hypothetical protein
LSVRTWTKIAPIRSAVRLDNDPSGDPTPRDVVRAMRNLLAAAVPVADELIVLNAWR